jgi:uncharacterized protein YigE (DUF2233 family)
MKKLKKYFFIISILFLVSFFIYSKKYGNQNDNFVEYIVNPKKQSIKMFWKDDKQNNFKSITNLKSWLNKNKKDLVFACNGGMYHKNYAPVGLFVENKITKTKIDTTCNEGNFYLKPNGIFYITNDNKADVCNTEKFINKNIKYATQSGPMLVIDGKIHSSFKEGSSNVNIRNGVGILPNNSVIISMSKNEINLFDFAKYFKNLGCKNALFFDAFVSRTYLPEQNWTQTDSNFGVIVAVVKDSKTIKK